MTQCLVAIYHPGNYEPFVETEAMSRDIGQGPMVALDAHDSCGRNSNVCRTKVAHTYEISRDEGVFQSSQHVKRSLGVDEHVWWIEEHREWGRLVRHGLFQEIM